MSLPNNYLLVFHLMYLRIRSRFSNIFLSNQVPLYIQKRPAENHCSMQSFRERRLQQLLWELCFACGSLAAETSSLIIIFSDSDPCLYTQCLKYLRTSFLHDCSQKYSIVYFLKTMSARLWLCPSLALAISLPKVNKTDLGVSRSDSVKWGVVFLIGILFIYHMLP